jgi:transcriptional regulator with XRE-family HTH domain
MVLLRQLLGDVLRRLRVRQGRTLREVSASARVSLGYLSEVERGRKEASSELLAAICAALDTPLSQVFREVSDNFALAELQNEPILAGALREPSLREPSLREPSLREPSLREPSLREPGLREPSLREPGLRIPADRLTVKRVAVEVPEAAESLDDDLGQLDDGLDHLPSVVGV